MSKLSRLTSLKYTGSKSAVRVLKAIADSNASKGMDVAYTVDFGWFSSEIMLFGKPRHVVETSLDAMTVSSGFTRHDVETVLDLCFTEGVVRA
jgi:hypothetical protein